MNPKKMFKILGAFALLIIMTAALPVNESSEAAAKQSAAISTAQPSKTTSAFDYKRAKKSAEEFKGEKLTLKEKIGLKLFGKKLDKKMASSYAGGEKSQLVALLLVALLGGLGIHRFYLGYTWQGIVQLLTLGGCGIWALIDLVRIIMGTLKPKDGEYDTTL